MANYNAQLTETVRKWFFAEPGRIWMVKMVTHVPKMAGMKMDEETEIGMTIRKLQKETYFENIVPHERMDEVDFESIAKIFLKTEMPG